VWGDEFVHELGAAGGQVEGSKGGLKKCSLKDSARRVQGSIAGKVTRDNREGQTCAITANIKKLELGHRHTRKSSEITPKRGVNGELSAVANIEKSVTARRGSREGKITNHRKGDKQMV